MLPSAALLAVKKQAATCYHYNCQHQHGRQAHLEFRNASFYSLSGVAPPSTDKPAIPSVCHTRYSCIVSKRLNLSNFIHHLPGTGSIAVVFLVNSYVQSCDPILACSHSTATLNTGGDARYKQFAISDQYLAMI